MISGVGSGDSLTVNQSQGTLASKDVGSNISVKATLAPANFVAGSGTLLSNYTLPSIELIGGIGVVTPKTLTYVAQASERVEGNANPVFNGTVTGFISGESIASATSGSVLFQSPATSASSVGQYPIVGSGLSATNYVFEQASANATALNVLPVPVAPPPPPPTPPPPPPPGLRRVCRGGQGGPGSGRSGPGACWGPG
jgi:hypothetical protein